jgi:hypothetical protein
VELDARPGILPPQFLQNLASTGFTVPQAGQLPSSTLTPQRIQCLAPDNTGSPHCAHVRGPAGSALCGLGGAKARGENTSERITTSPTAPILLCPSSTSRGSSRSSRIVLNCSLSTDMTSALMSPLSFGMAFRTRPKITPCESMTCNPDSASRRALTSLGEAVSAKLSTYFSQE